MFNLKMTEMEIVCIDRQTFEELRVRFCKLEEKVAGLCRREEDFGLKNWLDNQEACDILRISKKRSRYTGTRGSCRSRVSSTRYSSNPGTCKNYWNRIIIT